VSEQSEATRLQKHKSTPRSMIHPKQSKCARTPNYTRMHEEEEEEEEGKKKQEGPSQISCTLKSPLIED
jgi:hypothetical protein